jgi:hypothetical protein
MVMYRSRWQVEVKREEREEQVGGGGLAGVREAGGAAGVMPVSTHSLHNCCRPCFWLFGLGIGLSVSGCWCKSSSSSR